MDARSLRYFVSIVREGSFSRAAERLHIAQPALSLQMKKLEEELGTTLLHRSARGVTATEAGHRLLHYSTGILHLMDTALEDLRQDASEPIGQVTIALPQSVVMVLTVPLVEAALKTMPRVQLRIVETMSGYIPEWLRAGTVDLGLLFYVADTPGLVTEPFLEEDLYLLGPPGALGETITLKELAELPMILTGRPNGLREQIDQITRAHGVSLRLVAEVDAASQMLALAARGVGYCILSYSVFAALHAAGGVSAARIVDPPIRRSVYICRPANLPPTRAAQATAELCRKLMAELVQSGQWPARLLP